MLYLHETHQVVGKTADDFEATFREGWMPILAQGDDARLLYYMNIAHGAGLAYNATTITVVRDGAAWERLVKRLQTGDLRAWIRDLDKLRHDSTGKIMVPVEWSRLQDVDFAEVPTDARTHATTLFMEDTGWPYSSLDEYIRMWDVDYAAPMAARPLETQLLDVQACFQNAHSAGARREAMLWQKILDDQRLLGLFQHDTPPEHRGPGTYMETALQYRDEWRSRLLRCAAWSPWW